MPYLLSFLHSNSEDRVPEEGADVTLQFLGWSKSFRLVLFIMVSIGFCGLILRRLEEEFEETLYERVLDVEE